MAARATCRQYSCPPPIPLDDWSPGPGVGYMPVTVIPKSLLGLKAGPHCRDGHAHEPQAAKVDGNWLLFAEAVGPYIITAWYRMPWGFFAELVAKRSGRVLRSLRVCPPNGVEWGADSLYRRRAWALSISEAAAVTLRERKVPGRRPENEEWLRRQLAGLGKGGA